MADLQSTHTQALKLILAIRTGLERLEASEKGGRIVPVESLVKDLDNQIEHLQRCFQSLEAQWRMQSLREAPARREIWRQKVQAVADESYALAQGLHRWKLSDQQRAAELEQRVELLGTSGRPDVASQTEEAMRRGFQNSKRVLEEAFATGTSILNGMGSQRETLKNAQRRALDVLNSIGLSDSLLRMADRRHRMDKLFAYGGMALTLLLVILLYWWLKM